MNLDKMILCIGKVEIPLRCTVQPPRTCLIRAAEDYKVKAGTVEIVSGHIDEILAGRAGAPGLFCGHDNFEMQGNDS